MLHVYLQAAVLSNSYELTPSRVQMISPVHKLLILIWVKGAEKL